MRCMYNTPIKLNIIFTKSNVYERNGIKYHNNNIEIGIYIILVRQNTVIT